MDNYIYIIIIVSIIIIQIITSQVIKRFEFDLPISVPSTVMVAVFSIINFYFILLYFNKNDLVSTKAQFWLAFFAGGIGFAVFMFFYSKIPGIFNSIGKIIFIVLLTLVFIALLTGKPACGITDLSKTASKTAFAMFRIIFILGLSTIVQYKFFDFLPIPHLLLNFKTIVNMMNALNLKEFASSIEKDVPKSMINMGFFDFHICDPEIDMKPYGIFNLVNKLIGSKGSSPEGAAQKFIFIEFGQIALILYFISFIGIYTLIPLGLSELYTGKNVNKWSYIIGAIIGLLNFIHYYKTVVYDQGNTNKFFKKTNWFIEPVVTTLQMLAVALFSGIMYVLVYLSLFFVLFVSDLLSILGTDLSFIFGISKDFFCDIVKLGFQGYYYLQIGKFFYNTLDIGISFNEHSEPSQDCQRPSNMFKGGSFRSGLYSLLAKKSKAFSSLMAVISNNETSPLLNEEIFSGKLDGLPLYQGLTLCNINSDDKCKGSKLKNIFISKTVPQNNKASNIIDIKKHEYDANSSRIDQSGMINLKLLPLIFSTLIVYQLGLYSGFTNFVSGKINSVTGTSGGNSDDSLDKMEDEIKDKVNKSGLESFNNRQKSMPNIKKKFKKKIKPQPYKKKVKRKKNY